MRVLHTSDWHLGRNLEGRSRLSEQAQFIDELVTIVDHEDVQLILVAGDVFDTCNPSADAESLYFDALDQLCAGGGRAVVLIAGNHDSPERLHAVNPLALQHGISLLGYPGEQLPLGASQGGVKRLAAGPGWLELAIPGCSETAIVYMLPYPSEARLNEVLTAGLDDIAQQLAYSERVERLFGEADRVFRPDTVNLAMAHLFTCGGLESESERQLGGALAVSPFAMPKQAQYMALGHLHRPQQVHNAPQACRYSGSPLSFSFSEADQQKEVVLIDVRPGETPEVRPINLYCGKALKRWRAQNIEEARAWCLEPQNLSCWVELEIMVNQPLGTTDLAELRKAHPGIITIRPIFPEHAADADEGPNMAEMSLTERFHRFYEREQGIAPPCEIVDFFLEMVNRSESEPETDDPETPSPQGGIER